MTPLLFIAGVTATIAIQQAFQAWQSRRDPGHRTPFIHGAWIGAVLTALLIGMAGR